MTLSSPPKNCCINCKEESIHQAKAFETTVRYVPRYVNIKNVKCTTKTAAYTKRRCLLKQKQRKRKFGPAASLPQITDMLFIKKTEKRIHIERNNLCTKVHLTIVI